MSRAVLGWIPLVVTATATVGASATLGGVGMVWAGLGCSEGSTALPVVAAPGPVLPEPERPELDCSGPDWSEQSRPVVG